jgi:hypothetical protein
MRHALLVPIAIALAAPALAAPAGPKSCVALNRVGEQRIVGDSTIYFKEGATWYRNDIPGGCPGLTPRRSFSSRTPSTRLCSGDIITVFDPMVSIPYASCGLGEFTPVAGPPPRERR